MRVGVQGLEYDGVEGGARQSKLSAGWNRTQKPEYWAAGGRGRGKRSQN